jgi:hypothetical protein
MPRSATHPLRQPRQALIATVALGVSAVLALILFSPWAAIAAPGAWLSFQHDRAHTGVDSGQTAVTSVAMDWSLPLDGLLYAQPLVIDNTVIAATQNNSVYAIDATTHAVLWQTRLGQPAISGLIAGCGDPHGTSTDPSGITSTPIIDPNTHTLYVVALTQSGSALQFVLAALDLNNGAPRFTVPINPVATGGLPTFAAGNQDQRGALMLSQGRVYVTFGGLNGDCGSTYRGWVWAASATDGSGPVSYEVPAAAAGAAVWAPGGVAADASGNIFASTGNSKQSSTPDHSESVIRFSPTLQETAFFTPTNWAALNTGDLDLSSFGPLLLDNTQFPQYNGMVFQTGKSGTGYILQGSNLGGIGGELFSAPLCTAEVHGAATYVPPTIYLACRDQVLAVHLSTSGGPSFTVTTVRGGYAGGNPSAAGTPIWSGNRLWNIDINQSRLVMMDPSTGASQIFPLTGQPVHLATLASGASHIFVNAGHDLDAFVLNGGTSPTSTPTRTPTSTSTPTSTPVAATATPTATATPRPAASSTPTPMPSSTTTSTPVTGGTQTVTFDDLPTPSRPLTGQYPTGVIDWGSNPNTWFLSGPYDRFFTTSLSLGSTPTSGTFQLLSPRVVVQFDADNGGRASTTLSLACAGLPTVQATLGAGQVGTVRTNWTSPCSGTVTFGSTNGWDTNIDNIVLSNSGGAATATPTPTATSTPVSTSTATPTPTATPTRTPLASVTSTATPVSSAVTITFDDRGATGAALTGAYPAGVADWGSNSSWYLSGPWLRFTTNSVSFNGPSLSQATVTLAAGRFLERVDAFNGGTSAATLTLTCAGQSPVTASVPAGGVVQVPTGWTTPCAAVTFATTNGWDTNFDNLVVR